MGKIPESTTDRMAERINIRVTSSDSDRKNLCSGQPHLDQSFPEAMLLTQMSAPAMNFAAPNHLPIV
jgi:hypothetical protein